MPRGAPNPRFSGVVRVAALTLLLSTAACETGSSDYFVTSTASYLAVSEVVAQEGCSTESVVGLAWQIAREAQCLNPGELVEFEQVGGMTFGPAVLPLAAPYAVVQLEEAAELEPTRAMNVTSAYRAVPQQYILYTWAQSDLCGITAAATPGRSNHESGRAVDIANFGQWVATLAANGWDQNVPGDDVHFEHLSSSDLRGVDVLAFQRLWNRANPGDVIAEDGEYGPQTGARIAMAPIDGFDLPVGCSGMTQYSLEIAGRNAPARLRPNDRAMVELTLRNVGTVSWEAGTRLVVQGQSRLTDAPTWIDPSTPLALTEAVEPGAEITVSFAVVAPNLQAPGVVTEVLSLQEGVNTFGMVTLSMWVSDEDVGEPVAEEGTLPEAENEPAARGGCQAGGTGRVSLGWLVAAALLFDTSLRRRRAR